MQNSDVDFGAAAQRAAEAHLAACQEALWAEEHFADDAGEGPEELVGIDTPACAPFDGCDTCVVREVLHAAWPVLSGEAPALLFRRELDAAGAAADDVAAAVEAGEALPASSSAAVAALIRAAASPES